MRTTVRRCALAAASAALAVAALALPAAASPSAAATGWRVAATIRTQNAGEPGMLTADSARDGWSVWILSGNAALVDRWTGSAWVNVPVPAKFETAVVNTVAFGGDPEGDLWLFDPYPRTEVAHWSKGAWEFQSMPAWVLQRTKGGAMAASVAAFSPANIWLFNYGIGPYAAHYDGHGWAKVKLPAVPEGFSFSGDESADGPGSIWVTAASDLMHWNGKKWTLVPYPAVKHTKGESLLYTDLTAAGADNVWLFGGASGPHPWAMGNPFYWNGKAWTAVSAPATIIDSIAPDGSGGLWAIAFNPAQTTGGPLPVGPWRLYHLSGGHWTAQAPPSAVDDLTPFTLTWIPGTHSLWANGPAKKAGDSLILRS